MSAWLVSETHVAAIVTAAAEAGLTIPSRPDTLDAIGRELFAENMRSLRHCYGDADADEFWGEGDKLAVGYKHHHVTVAPFVLLKALACYDYQACETPTYEASEAASLTGALRAATLAQLGMTDDQARAHPAYRAAHWGLDAEHVAA